MEKQINCKCCLKLIKNARCNQLYCSKNCSNIISRTKYKKIDWDKSLRHCKFCNNDFLRQRERSDRTAESPRL